MTDSKSYSKETVEAAHRYNRAMARGMFRHFPWVDLKKALVADGINPSPDAVEDASLFAHRLTQDPK